ncbi:MULTISPECIES: helix-turn-helix domain-containing protein [Actinomadura]|uniref:helix-turn-helix domain-containing protein n=1 Tax=Actinomadura TaxID=1988 RepID=UPI002164CFDF|nr:helix-turn-helix transcriptional regulator [Actinomadura glauciflava]MCR3739827.1 helix-turn-helix protein [Actinomadura glauciflava]
MVNASPNPEISLYALMAYYLRFCRIKHGITQTRVGEIIGCTKGQVSKYEAGIKQLDERECAALDQAWDTGGLFSILLRYAKLGVDPNWPEKLRKYQREAVTLRFFHGSVIPMPFQTESYSRALLTAGHDAHLIDDVERAVAKRMEHQKAMLAGGPAIWSVLDEAALRPMGGALVMEEQRDHLLKLIDLRNISVRVTPESALPHIGVDGGFSHFELRNGLRAAFAGTSLHVGRIIDDQMEASRVAVRFERIAARSWSEDQSRDWIARMRL